MKTGTMIVLGLVLAAVAYQIVERVPAETLSVMLGVACGIGASIPVSVGLLIALLRQRQPVETYQELETPEPEPARVEHQTPPQRISAPQPQQPQIIVLAPQGQFAPGQFAQNGYGAPALQWLQQAYAMPPEPEQTIDARDWRIIGEE
ncbi:MAG: hypothetical protein HY741_28450 [Chloroflexi bacterium]|nr:hypothetical protein [Chloroflexota bacterium]